MIFCVSSTLKAVKCTFLQLSHTSEIKQTQLTSQLIPALIISILIIIITLSSSRMFFCATLIIPSLLPHTLKSGRSRRPCLCSWSNCSRRSLENITQAYLNDTTITSQKRVLMTPPSHHTGLS